MKKLSRKSRFFALLDTSKFWFFVYWFIFTAMLWHSNGHELSDFSQLLVLIPYAILSGFMSALVVLRLYTRGHFENDDDLKKKPGK